MRTALVLGAGGVTGGSFHAGTLAALADAGWDARSADLVIGTSAGAAAGAMLRLGLAPIDLVNRLTGRPPTPDGQRLLGNIGPPRDPPRPKGWTFPSSPGTTDPRAMLAAVRRGTPPNPFAAAAAAGPEGRVSNAFVRTAFDSIAGGKWPSQPLWITAVRQRDGRRVVFGRPPDPSVDLGGAVAASAAVPGLYTPVTIGTDRYIDGGAHSVHNADLVDPATYDVVVILAPMARRRRQPTVKLELALAAAIRAQLDLESRSIRHATTVEIIAPSDDDRRVMGPNPMDPSRRAEVATHIRDSIASRLNDELGARLVRAGLLPR
jgi:NTE family protein